MTRFLGCLVSGLSDLLAEDTSVCIYAGMRASESPQGTVPISLMVTSYRPDIVIYNVTSNSVALIELTCPLDSTQHLESARDRKQSKYEYLQILSKLDRLGVSIYDTVELSVLGQVMLWSHVSKDTPHSVIIVIFFVHYYDGSLSFHY